MKKWIAGSLVSLALAAGVLCTPALAKPGTFRFAEEVKLISLDPQQLAGGGISYMRPVYETLFRVGPDDRLEPLLATGYEADGLKIKFTLREGVKFSDGEPFDARAVVANLERGVKLAIQPSLKPIKSVEATGDHEVTVTLGEPSPSLIRSLAGAPGMMVSPKALADPALDRNPVGTGPYLYDKAQSREGEVRVYTPNPNYWAPEEVGLGRLEIWEMPDDTARLNALKTGQIDIGIWLTNPQSAIIDKTPGLKLIRNTGGNTYHLIVSDREGKVVPAFADKRVRQAMNYAIDRAAFSKAVDFGLSVPAYQPYPEGAWEHEPSLEGRYAYDPDKARALLKEAGYEKGFSFDMPSIPIFQSRLEAIAGFFKDIGITMNIVPVEPGTLARRSQTTDFPATNLVWNITIDPSYLTIRYIAENGAFNPFKVKPSETLASLGVEGMKSEDTDVRAPIYRKMAEELAEESYLIFVTSNPVLFGAREDVTKNPTVRYRPGEDTVYFRGLKVEE